MAIRARPASWIVDVAGKARTAVQRHPFATVLITALVVLAVAPIWSTRFLPLLDEPNHVSAVYVLRYAKDPSANLAAFYTRSFRFVPYMLHHLILWGLSYPLPIETANKVMQSLYILAFPCAALVWLRRTRRSPWLALMAFPLGYSFTWAHGFQPFNIGVPVLLFGVSAIDALLEKPSIKRFLWVMVLAFLCEIAHPLVFMGMGIGAVGLAVAYAFRPHRVVLAALCFVPSLGALKYQIAHSAATPFAMTVATTNAKGFDGTWIGWREMLRYLPAYSLDSVAGDWDVTAFWLIMGAGGALILTGLPLRRPSLLRLPAGIHEYRSLLVAAAFLAAYLALPLHLARPFDWWFVSGRLAGPLLFFTVLSASGRVDGQRRNLLIPVVAALVLLFVDVGGKYADYGRRMQPMVRMTRRIPRNDSVLLLSMFPRTDPSVNVEAYRCIGAWMQVMHGGFTPSGFFNSEFPFHVINQLPSPSWSAHESFDIENQAPAWGWLMVHGAVPPALSGSKSWELMSKDGVFSLYRRRH